MLRKSLFVVGALAIALATVPMFAAFEAHVINVTAQIENALAVNTEPINFGTVFPQEQLDHSLTVALSGSFLTEERVDDVSYIIRQKPKCAITTENGTIADLSNTATGHVVVEEVGEGEFVTRINCGEAPRTLEQGETWGVLPSLCPYLSKHSTDENDGDLNAFHQPWTIDNDGVVVWNDVRGYLTKLGQDITDDWNIDLKVPCFGGFCAQDWADYVHGINEGANPDDYDQDIANEHKVFGCDLWVEVTGVSETQPITFTSSVMNFSSTGWGGWSCPAGMHAVGGGTTGDTQPIGAEGIAEVGATIGGSTYPTFPHYTFSAGETGYVVQNGGTPQSMQVYVDCLPN